MHQQIAISYEHFLKPVATVYPKFWDSVVYIIQQGVPDPCSWA